MLQCTIGRPPSPVWGARSFTEQARFGLLVGCCSDRSIRILGLRRSRLFYRDGCDRAVAPPLNPNEDATLPLSLLRC